MIPQQHGTAIDIPNHHIHVAIIEEIADGKTARDTAFHQSLPSLITGITKSAVLLIEVKQLGLAIASARRQSIDLRVDVATDGDQIEPAIVVEVDKSGSPFNPWEGWK